MDPSAYLEMANTEHRHWWFVGRRCILESVISGFALSKTAKILEIGSGTGGNLDMLGRHGKVSAVEMDATARQMSIEKTNGSVDVRQGMFPIDMPFGLEKFDVICLFDVLEHIEQDTETLRTLKGLLTERGRLLVTVPAYSWLWSIHDEFLHHKRRYSKKEFHLKADAAGLCATKLTYFNSVLFPLAVVFRLRDKLFRRSTAAGTSVPPRALNAALAALFASERFVLTRFGFLFGVSLLAVLEAPATT